MCASTPPEQSFQLFSRRCDMEDETIRESQGRSSEKVSFPVALPPYLNKPVPGPPQEQVRNYRPASEPKSNADRSKSLRPLLQDLPSSLLLPVKSGRYGRKPDGIPESLARLLKLYIPPAAASSSDTSAKTTLEDAHERWIRFLPRQWMSDGCAPPTAAKIPTETSSTAQQQAQPSPYRKSDDAFKKRSGNFLTQTSHAEKQKQLWFLLTHYPHDASACLSLSFNLCHILNTMRQSPPPTLSSTDFSTFIGYLENTATGKRLGQEKTIGTDNIVSTRATCPCGCLVGGRFLDPALYRFHFNYYCDHSIRPRNSQRGVGDVLHRLSDRERNEETNLFNRHTGYTGGPSSIKNATKTTNNSFSSFDCPASVLRAAVGPAPTATTALAEPPFVMNLQAEPQSSFLALPSVLQQRNEEAKSSSLTFLQASLQLEVMPLLAIQTLASFVWWCSEYEYAFRQRQRRRLRAVRLSHNQNRAEPNRQGGLGSNTLQATAKQVHPSSHDLQNESERSSVCNFPLSPSALSGNFCGFDSAYKSFCDEKKRLWAAMACVRLAWSHLQRRPACAAFIPHLEVLRQAPSNHNRHQCEQPQQLSASSPQQDRVVSELQRVAAALGKPPEALADLLLKYTATPGGITPPCAAAEAYHRLRVRLLAHVEDRSVLPTQVTHAGYRSTNGNSNVKMNDAASVTQDLLCMESYVLTTLAGRTAQMPLWCQVALEIQQLYAEYRRRNCALQRACVDSEEDVHSLFQCETALERVYVHSVRRLVRLLVRLLLLPTCEAVDTTERLCFNVNGGKRTTRQKSTSRRSTSPVRRAAASGGRQHWQHADLSSSRVKERCTSESSLITPAPSTQETSTIPAPPAAVVVSTTLSDALTAMSQHMLHHPFFGVAVAVVSNAVPLSWAAACVTGTDNREKNANAADFHNGAPQRDMDIWNELMRLVVDTKRWLRSAEDLA